MKRFLALVSAIVLVSTVSSEDHHKAFWKEMMPCSSELGSMEHIKELIKNEDPTLGCSYACILENAEILVDGKFHIEKVDEYIEKHKDDLSDETDTFKTHVKTCHDEVEAAGDLEKCDFANKFFQCLHKLDKH